jgi:Asp-tRNA(Asn)/Glu-tRNA(Gln) amidotransferase A subunit family amidase
VADLFYVLDVLASSDPNPVGDFYNEQKIVSLPSVTTIRPESFSILQDKSSLQGKRIGVPSMYIGGDDSSTLPVSKVHTPRASIIKLWQEARHALEACGAEVIETDFPLVISYEKNASTGQLVTVANLPEGWAAKERCEVVSHAWDDFLVANRQKGLESLTSVDPATIFPLAPGSLLGTPEAANKPRWGEIVEYPQNKPPSIFEIPGMHQAVQALETARKETFETWMDDLNLDAVVFPAIADIGAANADVDEEASRYAWSNGIKYSNGNRPIRHLGIPTISIPMGVMEDINMPVSLTFAGRAYEDTNLLRYGFAFEMATKSRIQPPLVPALDSDRILASDSTPNNASQGLKIMVETQTKEIRDSEVVVQIEGSVNSATVTSMLCYINGQPCNVTVKGSQWSLMITYPVSERDGHWENWTSPALKQTIVLIRAHDDAGSTAGKLILL